MMKSKKIAICGVQMPFFHGGAEKLVNEFYRQLRQRHLSVDLINIPFKWYPKSRLVKECMVWRLLDLSESNGEKIDIVIPTKFPSTVVNHSDKRIWLIHQFREIYDLAGTPFSDFTGNLSEDRDMREILIDIDTRTLLEAKRLFCISKNVSKRMKKFNGIDSGYLYPPPANAERFFHDNYGDYVLYVGRFDSKKRLDLLMNAFKFTRSKVRCLLVGTGREMDRFKKMVTRLNLDAKITFLGWIPDQDLIKVYASALAVFYAPVDEDYGFVTLESFLSKKPVVTTWDSGGTLEFVMDGVNGFVVNANPEEIAEKLDFLYENRSKCRELGVNAYESVNKLSWDYVIERLVY